MTVRLNIRRIKRCLNNTRALRLNIKDWKDHANWTFVIEIALEVLKKSGVVFLGQRQIVFES